MSNEKQLSKTTRDFIKFCYVLPKDVLPEYVFNEKNKKELEEIRDAFGPESPEELIYHLYEGTWYEE